MASPLLLLAAAAVVAAGSDDEYTGGFGGIDALVGTPPEPGVALPPLVIPATSVTLAPTVLHNRGTGALDQPVGAITVLRTMVATLHRGRHFILRARGYQWGKFGPNTNFHGDPLQLCSQKQWAVQWNLLSGEVTWQEQSWNGTASQQCVLSQAMGNGPLNPGWALDREGNALWLRMTAVNLGGEVAALDLQSWASGGGDYP